MKCMGKTSLKVEMMVQYIKDNYKHYDHINKESLRDYLLMEFKCSVYMANQVIKKLFEDE